MTSCEEGRDYKKEGVKASTTNNIYGIYDIIGGTRERIMSAIASAEGIFQSGNSGFIEQPDSKYFDLYPNNIESTDFSKGKLGDATKETRKVANGNTNGWNNDYGYFPYMSSATRFYRGGHASSGVGAGLFDVRYSSGYTNSSIGAHAVLTP